MVSIRPGSTIDNKDRANVVLPVEVPPEIRMFMCSLPQIRMA